MDFLFFWEAFLDLVIPCTYDKYVVIFPDGDE